MPRLSRALPLLPIFGLGLLLDASPLDCETRLAFEHPDEGGRVSRRVYELATGRAYAPLLFVDTLKSNSDGTVTSYHQDDPRGDRIALNDVVYAMSPRRPELFDALRARDWEPLAESRRLLGNVIEFDRRNGRPCVTGAGYMISMTYVAVTREALRNKGDCDPKKWLDALEVPAVVLPMPRAEGAVTGFDQRGADARNLVVAMTTEPPYRVAYGIVGDKGPPLELGEGTIAFNRELNGLPRDATPRHYPDVRARFQGERAVTMVFPGTQHRIDDPITPERVRDVVARTFEAWGGASRLRACLATLPDEDRRR